MNELDQAAVEAVAKAIYEADCTSVPDPEYVIPWERVAEELQEDYRKGANAAIRAYQTAMAPQVREAVSRLIDTSADVVRAAHFEEPWALKAAVSERSTAERALLELLGAQEAK